MRLSVRTGRDFRFGSRAGKWSMQQQDDRTKASREVSSFVIKCGAISEAEREVETYSLPIVASSACG